MRKVWIYKLKLLLLSTAAITTIVHTITHPTRNLLLLPIAAMSTMEISCKEDTLNPSDYTEQPPDACPSWDTDCDEISNATETNGANSYLNLDPKSPDDNPSIAQGEHCDGWIENALNLMNEGTGYYHYNPEKIDTDDWGTLHLVNMIEGAGRDWYNNNWWPPRIGVGDLSWGNQYTQQFGGYWSDHVCHQNGTEADFRYVRNDGIEDALNVRTQPALYDTAKTIALMNYLFANSKSIKIIVSPYCGIEFTGIDTAYDASGKHDNHFHLRIEDPDGTGN